MPAGTENEVLRLTRNDGAPCLIVKQIASVHATCHLAFALFNDKGASVTMISPPLSLRQKNIVLLETMPAIGWLGMRMDRKIMIESNLPPMVPRSAERLEIGNPQIVGTIDTIRLAPFLL
jgi:hypothetical protein